MLELHSVAEALYAPDETPRDGVRYGNGEAGKVDLGAHRHAVRYRAHRDRRSLGADIRWR